MRLFMFAALAALVSVVQVSEKPADLTVEATLGRILGSTMSSVSGRPSSTFLDFSSFDVVRFLVAFHVSLCLGLPLCAYVDTSDY